MQSIRPINLQKNLGDVLSPADVEAVPNEAPQSRPALHRRTADPLGYDTRDPSYINQVASDALSGKHPEEIAREIDSAMRRWGLR
ncbi:hypothetical protein [Rhizobium sp.]|jgi:hypothetical protein|uniref:hypothetical protein n=1 Tax=Rhizobium sp. TaxID=391 RepID=UPI000DB9D82E